MDLSPVPVVSPSLLQWTAWSIKPLSPTPRLDYLDVTARTGNKAHRGLQENLAPPLAVLSPGTAREPHPITCQVLNLATPG